MANLSSSADILDWVMFQAGEPTDGTSDFAGHAVEALNRAYRDIWMGGGAFVEGMNEPWLWLKKDPPGTLTLEPIRTTGTVDVTNNNATATLSATVSVDLDGWFFKVVGHPDVFRVSAHTAGSAALTLDSVYTGPTNATATYQLMKLEYELANDILRPIAPMRTYSDNYTEIEGIDLSVLDRDYPLLDMETGTPDRFALVTETKVRFNRAGGTTSTDYRRVDYDYLREPSDLADDATEPLVPLAHRHVLADATLFYLLTAKSDNKAEGIGLQTKAGLLAMQSDNRKRLTHMSRSVGWIYPRRGMAGSRRDRPLRTSSGFIIT